MTDKRERTRIKSAARTVILNLKVNLRTAGIRTEDVEGSFFKTDGRGAGGVLASKASPVLTAI